MVCFYPFHWQTLKQSFCCFLLPKICTLHKGMDHSTSTIESEHVKQFHLVNFYKAQHTVDSSIMLNSVFALNLSVMIN